MKKMNWKKFLIALILPQCAGAVGSIFTRESVATWYPQLNRPLFTPPSWVFAPVWTTLFLLMGWAFFLILSSDHEKTRRGIAISLFCIHLAVNILWSFFFFGLRSPFWAFVDISILWGMIALLVRIFWGINRWAGVMLVPYFLWVSFASFLNYGLWRMN